MGELSDELSIEQVALRQLDCRLVYTFSYSGVLEVGDTKLRLYNDTSRDRKIRTVRVSVGGPPVGQGIYIDLWQNGVSMYDETRGDYPEAGTNPRPYIFPDAYTATRTFDTIEGAGTGPDVWSTGSYLVVHIDQVGTTYAGSDLTINVVVEE